MTIPTGVDQLDAALDGGLPAAGSYLIRGPAFSGKELFARRFVLQGLAEGEPGVFLLTDETASQVRDNLADLDKHYPEYEKEELVRFVDTYSRSVDADPSLDHAEYLPSCSDLNSVMAALNKALADLAPGSESLRVLLDSASTLAAYNDTSALFRFLQVCLGRLERAGATSLVLMESGMHEESDVESIKHVVDGVIDLRTGSRTELRLEGFPGIDAETWVEYRFDEETFELVGTFTEGRIH